MNRNLKLIGYLLFAIGLPLWLFYLSRDEKKGSIPALKIEADSITLNKLFAFLQKRSDTSFRAFSDDSVNRKLSELQTNLENFRNSAGEGLQAINDRLDTLPGKDSPKVRSSVGRFLWISKNFGFSAVPGNKDVSLNYKNLKSLLFDVDTLSDLIEAVNFISFTNNVGSKYRCVIIEMENSLNSININDFLLKADQQQLPVIIFDPYKRLLPSPITRNNVYTVSAPGRVYQLLQIMTR